MEKIINPNGLAIYNTLKDNQDKILSFAEIAGLANVEPKTGYLTSARKIAAENGYEIVKVENGVTVTVTSTYSYPYGMSVEKTKEVTFDGYRLAPKAQ